MNILLVHNFYQQAGGEDQVFADEALLLRSRGHNVREYTVHNDAVDAMGRLALARKTVWNRDSYSALRKVVREHAAEVVHFHNTFPLISPAGYRAARDEGAAVVQTLHNYRLLCPSATFFRDGRVCEDCLGHQVPWPGVVHKCYRSNRAATAVVATMLATHRMRGTWTRDVDQYIALTEFSRQKFVQGGLPVEKITVKPNFVDPDPGVGAGTGGFLLFVGRLTEEKGVRTLLKAWELLSEPRDLRILGDGPMRLEVERAASENSRIQYLGRQPLGTVYDTIGAAGALVFPSQWYEGLPRTIVESFAKGTPVIASRLGSMAELIDHGRTGWLFEPGDPADLAQWVSRALSDQPRLQEARHNARLEFERLYTADQNYRLLVQLYHKALSHTAPAGDVAGSAPGETTP